MDELLYKPRNSLIRQSVAAHESEEPLNGDGFGVGWYEQRLGTDPGLFVSVRPAWNDRNLRYISQKIESTCIFAHVRAASLGEVSEANCHPFHYKNYLFMHNGGIEGFSHIKRYMRRLLSDEIYEWIRGQTDSEHLFALFLEQMRLQPEKPSAAQMAEALEETIRIIRELKAEYGVNEDDYVNVAVSDGRCVVAIRYVSNPKERASTLYYSQGAKYECHDGICIMTPVEKSEHAVLIVSEKLTTDRSQWKEIPQNHLLIVEDNLDAMVRPFRTRAHQPARKTKAKASKKTTAKKAQTKVAVPGFRRSAASRL